MHSDNFAGRIEAVLEGRSVRGLSRDSGLSETVLRAYVKGSDPSRRAIEALARATGRSVEWLVTGKETGFETPACVAPRCYPPISDRRLGELLAWLTETWELHNEHGRETMLARFDAAFPERRVLPPAADD